MTTKPNDGGPAFPGESHLGQVVPGNNGMSLRDYFAARAMMLVFRPFEAAYIETSGGAIVTDIARRSYDLADAMLKAREGDQS